MPGSLVPITGFANSIVSPAMEYKSEGYVMGVGGKMFTVAGPVLVFGISASIIVGIIYLIFNTQNMTLVWCPVRDSTNGDVLSLVELGVFF